VNGKALLIFGLGERCTANAGMPAQLDRFLPRIGHIPGQIGKVAYG
jgi:AraC family transcriptional regulator